MRAEIWLGYCGLVVSAMRIVVDAFICAFSLKEVEYAPRVLDRGGKGVGFAQDSRV